MNFANTFLRTPFYRTHPVAAPVKACNFTNIRPNVFWCAARYFLKVHKKTGEKMFAKYLSADGCFVKTNTINCDDNDNAICFLILGRLLLLGRPWNEISLEALEWFISSSAFLCRLVLICKKIEDEPVYCPDRCELLQISRPCKSSHCFQKVEQLFNLMQDYFPIRDSKRCVKKCL